jgi:hypothetical protein
VGGMGDKFAYGHAVMHYCADMRVLHACLVLHLCTVQQFFWRDLI